MIKVLNKTKKQKKEMQAMFDGWLASYEECLQSWLGGLPKAFSSKLDFSLESLLPIESYIKESFSSVEDVTDLGNSGNLCGIAIYIGEVYRRNSPVESYWAPPASDFKVDDEKFNFFWGVKSGLPNSYYDPASNFQYIVYNQSVDDTYNMIKRKIEKAKAHLASPPEPLAPEVPGRGGFSHQYFMLVEDAAFDLEQVKKRVEAYIAENKMSWKVAYHTPTHLYVQVAEDYCFHFDQYYKDLDFVAEEAKEVAEKVDIFENQQAQHTREGIANSKVRIEFWGDKDNNWDFGNEHLWLLEQFKDDSGMHIYDIHSGNLFPAG